MESARLKLYVGADFVSAFAMSAFIGLKEKQLSFDIVTVDLKARENYLLAYRDLSLTCKIPTLVHEGFALSESSAIAEYLDEIAPATRNSCRRICVSALAPGNCKHGCAVTCW
jgi:glutathione S-transferase